TAAGDAVGTGSRGSGRVWDAASFESRAVGSGGRCFGGILRSVSVAAATIRHAEIEPHPAFLPTFGPDYGCRAAPPPLPAARLRAGERLRVLARGQPPRTDGLLRRQRWLEASGPRPAPGADGLCGEIHHDASRVAGIAGPTGSAAAGTAGAGARR